MPDGIGVAISKEGNLIIEGGFLNNSNIPTYRCISHSNGQYLMSLNFQLVAK